MLPAGRITEETVERLGALLEPDDIIIDGGNTFYKDQCVSAPIGVGTPRRITPLMLNRSSTSIHNNNVG
jgi:hypothetical protein